MAFNCACSLTGCMKLESSMPQGNVFKCAGLLKKTEKGTPIQHIILAAQDLPVATHL